MPALDGVASVAIGLLLAAVALLLIREARGLLIGEGVRPETAREIRAIACAEAAVRHVGQILTMYIGSQDVLLALDVEFDRHAPAGEVSAAVGRIEQRVREQYPMIKRIYIEATDLATRAQ